MQPIRLCGDLTVNIDDLILLTQNYGHTARTFAQSDVNYDGQINFDDLLAAARLYGTGSSSQLPRATEEQATYRYR